MITVIVNISKIRDKFGHVTVSTLFQTQLFWSLVVPILATYVVWLIVSVLFLSPWHMVTSVGVPFPFDNDKLLSKSPGHARFKGGKSKSKMLTTSI